jgi:hypothetical protein
MQGKNSTKKNKKYKSNKDVLKNNYFGIKQL